MADMSKWDADLPGDTAAWWTSRKGHVPMKAKKQFKAFIGALNEYHGNFSEDNLNSLRWAIDDVVTALNESAKKSKNWVALEIVPLGLVIGGPSKRRPLRDDVNAESLPSNLEIGLMNLKNHLGKETMSRGAKEWGQKYVDTF